MTPIIDWLIFTCGKNGAITGPVISSSLSSVTNTLTGLPLKRQIAIHSTFFLDINLWKKYFHNIGIHNLFWILNKKQTYIIVKLCFIINNSRYYQNKHFTSENLVYILMAAMKIISLPRKLILVLDVVTELNVWISITEASHISHLCIWQLQNLGSVIVLHLHDIKDAVCALK